jgi:hypothetical protein
MWHIQQQVEEFRSAMQLDELEQLLADVKSTL